MTGRFIISLDCEGKWGMADSLQPYHHRMLTDDALARAYQDLVEIFDRHAMPATFAYVMAFTMDATERERFADSFDVDDDCSGGWLRHYRAAREAGALEGWFQPSALETVRRHPQHEIACHGFCHRPLSEGVLSAEAARMELDTADRIAKLKGVKLSTFIFPRNQVGHVSILTEKGYIGYRAARPRPRGRFGRLRALAEEFDIWPRPERPERPATGGIVRIPAGYFFNWRFGARRRVPPAITVRRWKNLLDRAAAEDGVAHLWFHPHNLITGPQTRVPLEKVLAYAAKLRTEGRLKVVTQEDYCRDILSQTD